MTKPRYICKDLFPAVANSPPLPTGLMGLIKFRRHPQERVIELAKTLASYGGNERFRQDLIDYNWLLDKFESEALAAEDKRKAEEAARSASNTATNSPAQDNANNGSAANKNEGPFTINVSSEDYQQSWTVPIDINGTDEEAIAAAEKVVGHPLTEGMKKQVRESRRAAYVACFTDSQAPGYEGGYYGDEKLNGVADAGIFKTGRHDRLAVYLSDRRC